MIAYFTLVLFTNKHNLNRLKEPPRNEFRFNFSKEVKYLGVVLDYRLRITA